MGFVKDFKEFAMRGNVMDLAVGVIIGAAFGKIVTALVNDIIMPIVGLVTPSGTKFTDKFFVFNNTAGTQYKSLEAARAAGANAFAYGDFIQTIVDFLIVAICIFLIINLMNKLNKKKEEAPAAPAGPTPTEQLLMEIRDELKRK